MLLQRREGSIAVLTLDRPEARNAIHRELVTRICDAIADAAGDAAVGAIVLASSHESVFAAGGDLHEFARLPMDERGAEHVLGMGVLTQTIEDCALPVIAAVSGAALGGGSELCVACDLVVMGPRASIRFVHARMGLVPAWGGLTRLEERVGALCANELMFTGRTIGTEEALALGLANRRADEALSGAIALANEVAAQPRDAIVEVKRSAVEARKARRGGALLVEQDAFRRAWGSPAHRAAFEALRKE